MVTYDDGASAPQPIRAAFLARYVFSTHHKTIGLQYLWLALASVFVGVVLSTLLRVHTSWPDTAIPFLNGFENTTERYAAVRLLHGSLMVFFVLTAAPQLGFVPYLESRLLLADCGLAGRHDRFVFLRTGNRN
jgi:heme/copper-type cytochrome/quinol oxidase subunit 1